MSITDELREWMGSHTSLCLIIGQQDVEEFYAIADCIDAEYQKAIRELNNLADASVLLPVDADGVPIRIGDVMEGVDKYDTLKKVKGKVITVSFESDGAVDVAVQAWNSDGKSWHRAYLDPDASVYRHYHEPTVEDVLREFTDAILEWAGKSGSVAEVGTWSDVAAEYASKLRLAGDGA